MQERTIIDTSILCRIAYREATRLGELLGVDSDVVEEVYSRACSFIEEHIEADPRDVVKAFYHVVLEERSMLNTRRRSILSNPSLSWLSLLPLVKKHI